MGDQGDCKFEGLLNLPRMPVLSSWAAPQIDRAFEAAGLELAVSHQDAEEWQLKAAHPVEVGFS
jgi:hypothetical protein